MGQGIRVIVGLKKVYDEALQQGTSFSENFNGSSLLFSLLIGFIAGVLGIIGLEDFEKLNIGKEHMITLIGIGYAGADFIEGFIKKNTPKVTAAAAAAKPDKPQQPPIG